MPTSSEADIRVEEFATHPLLQSRDGDQRAEVRSAILKHIFGTVSHMKSRMHFSRSLALGTMLFVNGFGFAQGTEGQRVENPLIASNSSPARGAFSSSNEITDTGSAAAAFVQPVRVLYPELKPYRPFTRFGIAWRGGLSGGGFDIATPLAKKLNARVGADFFGHAFSFREEGANVDLVLGMHSGHAALDWFPFGGRLRLSPYMVFANNNQIKATALIPSGGRLSINGQDYVSSSSDPLHGSGSVTFRKVSPGFTIGFGNTIPRTKSHLSFPIEAGFYYVGQPRLKVDFTGSACDPMYPEAIGCQSVTEDPGFQKDLTAFIARNNRNLSYASFFPVFSTGFSYSF
jgi:hypothetical protein